MWWEKPFEVDYPTIINSNFLQNVCAFKWMQVSSFPLVMIDGHECSLVDKSYQDYLPWSKVGLFPLDHIVASSISTMDRKITALIHRILLSISLTVG